MRFATLYRRDDLPIPFRRLPFEAVAVEHFNRAPEGERRKLEFFLDDDGRVKELADAGEPHRFPFIADDRLRADAERLANMTLPEWLADGAVTLAPNTPGGPDDEARGWPKGSVIG